MESFEAKFEASNYEAMMIFMKLWQELVLIIFGKFIKASEREKEELIKALTSVLSKSNYMGKNIRKLFFFSHDCRLHFLFSFVCGLIVFEQVPSTNNAHIIIWNIEPKKRAFEERVLSLI